MAIIDLVKWEPDGGQNVFAWRFPHSNLSTYTQLLVQESQEAVLFSKGQVVGKFGPGKHTLNTENLPILRSLYGLPFGGKNPFTAEVWFVNKLQPYNIGWEINGISIHDVDYNTQLPLAAGGQYGLRIEDAEKFLIKIVGTNRTFTEDDMTSQFYGEVTTKTKSAIVQYMMQNNVGFKRVSAYLDMLSEYLKNAMSPFWHDLGVMLTKFYVSTIEIDDSTPEGARVKDAIARQSAMSITGHTWQQEQVFDTANNAIGSMNDGGGMIGGLMAIGMMGGFGGGGVVGSGAMTPNYNQPTFSGQPSMQSGSPMQQDMPQPEKMVYCSNCAKKFSNKMRFCPHCGDIYNPCPKCGTDNEVNAKRCISCGTYLQSVSAICPHCNKPIAAGSSFCGNCGKPTVVSNDVCSRCGTPLSPSVKFCPVCGNKR